MTNDLENAPETCTAYGEVNHGLTYSPTIITEANGSEGNARLCDPCWEVQYDHGINACGDNPHSGE